MIQQTAALTQMFKLCMKLYLIKDARSVSLYPYNQSQIFQYVKNTK